MLSFGLSLIPVTAFLLILYLFDNFRLVKSRLLFTALFVGILTGAAAFIFNTFLLQVTGLNFILYARYLAPLIEEGLKVIFLLYLIQTNKVGFLVDTSIYAFAIGTGFALFENTYYLFALHESELYIWLFRGFGTAIMHSTVVVLFGIIYKFLSDIVESKLITFAAGYIVAIVIHSFYNHFLFTPFLTTLIVLFIIFGITLLTYYFSEKSLSKWLHSGLNDNIEIIKMLNSREFKKTKLGIYLSQLQNIFDKEILLDIYCYIQLYTELSLKVKGKLLLNEAGWDALPVENVSQMLNELNYLENNIGKTGLLALKPILKFNKKELWQLTFLK